MRLNLQLGAVFGHLIPQTERLRTGINDATAAAFGCADLIDQRVTASPVNGRQRNVSLFALNSERCAEQSAVFGALENIPMVLTVHETGFVLIDDLDVVKL